MRTLMAILVHRIGAQRRPFLVLDVPPSPATAANRELSARAAGMRGYLMAASKTEYVFKNDSAGLTLDVDKLIHTIAEWKAEGASFCLLGYTFVLYCHVVAALRAWACDWNCPRARPSSISAGGKSFKTRR